MVELIVDTFVKYSFPSMCADLVRATATLGAAQDPPFSHGNFFIEIRKVWLEYAWVNKAIYGDIVEPIFTLVCRLDYFYCDSNFGKFSTKRCDETYRTFSENLAHRWPGYVLAQSGHIFNSTDRLVHMDDLLNLLRSKDIDRYEREKDLFFSH